MAREPERIADLRRALGGQLATFRTAAGLTQGQLAALVYSDRTRITHIEKGRSSADEKFWQVADEACNANGLLLTTFGELEAARAAFEQEVRAAELAAAQERAAELRVRSHEIAVPSPTGSPGLGPGESVYVPVIVNGRSILMPLDMTDWDAMSPLNRRLALGYGLATAAASMLPTDGVVATLLHQQAGPPSALSAPPQGSWAEPIYNAVVNPVNAMRQATADANVGNHAALRQLVDRAIGMSLASDYGALERSLPGLTGLAEATATQPGGGDPAVQRAMSDLYATIGWTLIKADSPTAAWIAAQRAIQAAEQADDVLRIAAATRCLAEVHMRAENYEEATRTAFLATVHLERASTDDRPTALSLRGASLLSAAAASARRGDSREAYAALKAAAICAEQLRADRSDLATVFGPTNVAIHQVAIPVELGDARTAVRHVPDVHLDQMPKLLSERRTRFLIDVARSYLQAGDHSAAIDALVQAETIAPDELRHHRLTRQLVPQLMARESRTSELRELAARCNLLT